MMISSWSGNISPTSTGLETGAHEQVDRAVEVVETLALVDLVVPVAKAMWVVPV
jgi:hypothetical protein